MASSHRVEAHGYFGHWFDQKLLKTGYSIPDVAHALQIDMSTIRKQRSGKLTPKFLHIIGYIWFFNSDEDATDLYNKCIFHA